MPPNQRYVNRNRKSRGRGAARGSTRGRGALVSTTHSGASLASVAFATMPLFPPRTFRRLRYSTSVNLTATSGIPTAYIFRANDLFDPDFTSTGHQPMGFDQMMVFYNHFCVLRSKITIVGRSTTSGPGTIALRQDADATVITDADRIMEFGGVISDVLEGKGVYGANKELSLGVSISRLQGVSNKAITADSTLRGSAAASPSEITYYHLCLWDRGGQTVTAQADVVIDYFAYFVEPRDFSTSLSRPRPEVFKAQDLIKTCMADEVKEIRSLSRQPSRNWDDPLHAGEQRQVFCRYDSSQKFPSEEYDEQVDSARRAMERAAIEEKEFMDPPPLMKEVPKGVLEWREPADVSDCDYDSSMD